MQCFYFIIYKITKYWLLLSSWKCLWIRINKFRFVWILYKWNIVPFSTLTLNVVIRLFKIFKCKNHSDYYVFVLTGVFYFKHCPPKLTFFKPQWKHIIEVRPQTWFWNTMAYQACLIKTLDEYTKHFTLHFLFNYFLAIIWLQKNTLIVLL